MWSTDADENVIQPEDDVRITVSSRAAASAYLAEELSNSASDEFLDNALYEWFNSGKVSALPENVQKTVFWNVELID